MRDVQGLELVRSLIVYPGFRGESSEDFVKPLVVLRACDEVRTLMNDDVTALLRREVRPVLGELHRLAVTVGSSKPGHVTALGLRDSRGALDPRKPKAPVAPSDTGTTTPPPHFNNFPAMNAKTERIAVVITPAMIVKRILRSSSSCFLASSPSRRSMAR